MQVKVTLGSRSYPVVIDIGRTPVSHRLIETHPPDRILAVFDAQLCALHGKTLLSDLKKAGRPVLQLVLPFDEVSKNSATVAEIQGWMLQGRISHSDLIVACGGGVTSDVVGFAAATILRGVQWGVIPTTLVGMIDAAIGGKTGVNHATAKNVIGAFWQPSFVYAHVPFLATLSERQLFAGAGEMVKYAGLIGGKYINQAAQLIANRCHATNAQWERIIAKAVACKAALVSKDERDTGVRQFLNLGHTFGHGIEQSLKYRSLLHGEAVLIGLLAALNLSQRRFRGADRQLASYRQLVESAVTFAPYCKIDIASVLSAMQLDKKRLGSKVRFVLLKRPGKPVIQTDIETSSVREALADAIDYYSQFGGRSVKNTHYKRT